jgi:hypothetical protein
MTRNLPQAAIAPGSWHLAPGEGLRVSWTRHLARELLVIEGYGLAGEPPLGRV